MCIINALTVIDNFFYVKDTYSYLYWRLSVPTQTPYDLYQLHLRMNRKTTAGKG